ncbi:MAG: methyltransferase domain-containing protein [bacterium]|nr:methyltransferase domain-containing protein [bacterium]
MLDRNFWKKYFEVYDVLNRLIPYTMILDDMISVAGELRGRRVLDLGSGTGNLAVMLCRSGANVTAVDYSSEGQEIHSKKQDCSDIVLHDITQPLPFSNDSFDIVFSNNTLYTIPRHKRKKIFSEIYRITKPEGRVIVCNLNYLFDPKRIYLAHIRDSAKKHGLWKTIIDIFKLIVPTTKMFYYNYLIKKANTKNVYDFFKEEEQADSLQEAGFSLSEKTKMHYAGQAFLDIGIK